MDTRFLAMTDWLRNDLQLKVARIVPASADASFRRYFRILVDGAPFIVMDAPPDKEDCAPFIRIAQALHEMGLNVPRIEHANLEAGFLLLSDLGEDSYLSVLNGDTVDQLYRDAIDALLQMQQQGRTSSFVLPVYDRPMFIAEMELFCHWLLGQHLELSINGSDQLMLTQTFDLLVDNAVSQPRVWVHRDYHSRNLMARENNPGILDFQDAVFGPMSYDLVSLLRDCYIEWPVARQQQWCDYYCDGAEARGLLKADERHQFKRWFDLMGVQRHLKAAGIFARLYHRDGKDGYLADIPRTLTYVCWLAADYPELRGLVGLIEQRVLSSLPTYGIITRK